ncbi:MAG: 16S rRNA (cytidine(1402)-2'-O)-methyltransferase [Gammaproteobacteria bacterium]|nr:16S rRNA (cytidine(1402)-2'-O)-methyltransferase [Gammaproteobacteria bacterium]MBU1554647.1 16S rRNA (cytidine(1402)-2'-O)-methyltransferase [Gammaproteobacteria bacterium]MBU2070517.1 16S rRNA (cytidine(1402)-2'-O)-methyltransferase [Gammaproteobacteria bacterium]MBU2185318.1 16S rRNA (cytidine(1402)-2'-O)-methyltransferase [Gammaproteobacteria bacterium]MBU2203209.1 16S rRNA (cytidine(1402)-2'-O)-methyltransferase [Gammaproteobacteria bacterium]
MAKENGFLYVVATPIGNLDDISQRAINTLQQVGWIAAEDTRHTGRLLSHLGISAKTIALHDHNEKQRAAGIIEKCLAGESVALVSDAGTPLISDPGYSLVRQCRDAGVRVIPIPGPCALITALCAAGLPTDKFHFIGFLLPKSQQRQNQLAEVPAGVGTIICYDTARRIKDTLQDVVAVFGSDRELVLAKELTKTFEHLEYGTAAQITAWLEADPQRCQGEMVLMIAPTPKADSEVSEAEVATLKLLLGELPLKKAAALTAQIHGGKKNALYKLALHLSGETE